jgi:hypothetical protein
MRVTFLVIWFFLGIFLGSAQKETREVLEASDIRKIEIYADEVYKISLSTVKTEKVIISTHSEGEYYNDISLVTQEEEHNLKLTTRYPEALTGGYDKLSAHKVISMEIELQVPENIQVYVRSNLASVVARGSYENFYADLKSGYCRLSPFIGNAIVNTYKGNIYVETTFANIEAESRNGEVRVPKEMQGANLLKLKSINGDISVFKTK